MMKDLNVLLGDLAKSMVEKEARSKGRGVEQVHVNLDKLWGKVRRALSIQVVRSQGLYLLEHFAQLGTGARAAGDRHKALQRIEDVQNQQAEAYRSAHRNYGLCCVGHSFVP